MDGDLLTLTTELSRRIAAGDLSQDIKVQPGAGNSLLAAVRDMSGGLAAIVGEVRSGSSRIRPDVVSSVPPIRRS